MELTSAEEKKEMAKYVQAAEAVRRTAVEVLRTLEAVALATHAPAVVAKLEDTNAGVHHVPPPEAIEHAHARTRTLALFS